MTRCSACIVPVAGSFRERGASVESTIAIALGPSTLNAPALFMTVAVFSPMLAASRIGLSVLGAVLIGRDQEPVACGIDLTAAEPSELLSDHRVMGVEQLLPLSVPHSAANPVDPTMSVKRTVMRTREARASSPLNHPSCLFKWSTTNGSFPPARGGDHLLFGGERRVRVGDHGLPSPPLPHHLRGPSVSRWGRGTSGTWPRRKAPRSRGSRTARR